MSRLLVAVATLVVLGAPARAARPAKPAPPPPPPPPNAAGLTEEQLAREIRLRSPAGAAERGVARTGVFDIHDPRACSRWAAEALLARRRDPPARLLANEEMVLDRSPAAGHDALPLQIGPLARTLEKDLRAAWEALHRAADPALAGRHVCVGLAVSSAASDEAARLGFVLFDPQLYYDLNRAPQRTMRTGAAIAAHALAHQLQLWTRDPALVDPPGAGERPARQGELVADCAAAALVAEGAPEIGNAELWKISRPGLRGAFAGLGDLAIFDGRHHGLAQERSLAAEQGIRLVERLGRPGRQRGFASGWLLQECRATIEQLDGRYGVPWPASAELLP